MATPLQVGMLLKLRTWCIFSAEQQASVNTFWYVCGAIGPSPASDLDCAAELDALLAPLYKPAMHSLAEYRGTQCQIYESIEPFHAAFGEQFDNSNNGPGTGAGDPLPSQTCGLISYSTNLPHQANRGRTYIPFPPAGANSAGGSPSAAYGVLLTNIAAITASGLAVSQAGRTATLVRVLFHGKNKDDIRPIPAETPISGSSVSNLWATQRKRGLFGRHNNSPI